jgi:hypothetical protein
MKGATMTKMLDIRVSPKTALFLQLELTEHVFKKMQNIDAIADCEGIAELIAELRTLQKLMIAYNHHYAICDCCE